MRPEGSIVKNGNRNTSLPVGSPEFYIALGALASKVGRSRFYRDLARILCRVGRGDLHVQHNICDVCIRVSLRCWGQQLALSLVRVPARPSNPAVPEYER